MHYNFFCYNLFKQFINIAKRRNLNNSRTVNFNKIASVYNIIRHNKIYKNG